jgi:hypothetical protein
VEGHIAAAVTLEHLNATLSKLLRSCDHVRPLGVPAKSDHGAVLE